ncbi:MAG: hypothetical protein SVY53_02430 [Chloroflexota bacterium]|nr:hypothetical protein [Chloroflexota bacterium]
MYSSSESSVVIAIGATNADWGRGELIRPFSDEKTVLFDWQ